VGCGAIRKLDERTGEIKRMWLDPSARGRGVGRSMLEALEQSARHLGCECVRLDTSAYLFEAIGLYRSFGFVDIAPYNDNSYADFWFEKSLAEENSF
jgi:ribosomal protein S18 acetylase RimI-like enzyme